MAGEGVGVLRKEMENALRDWAERVGNEAIDLGGVGATATAGAGMGEGDDDMDI